MEISRKTILSRTLRCRCPNCGHKPIFKGLRLLPTCPVCYTALQRGSGWWLGPLVINYGMVVFGVILPLLAAGLMGWLALKTAVYLAVFCAVLIPLLLYRWSWGLWLMVYYLVLPHELPSNNTDFDLLDNE